jgi:hypothetical protein
MKAISNNYWTDGTNIFYQNYGMKNPKIIPEVDMESFRVHSCYLASDKNRIYAQSSMGEGLQIFYPEDRESIIFFPQEISSSEFVDNYNLYNYNTHFIEFDNIANEHKAKLINWLKTNYPDKEGWWNINNTFYNQLKPIACNFFTDGKRVFYKFNGEHTYDYPTYRCRHNDFYLQLKNADTKTFYPLNSVYSKDKNNVYFYSREIPADATTFKVINELFAQDKNGIWYNGRIAKIEHLNTFEVIKSSKKNEFHFAKDQFNVYGNATVKMDKFSGYADLLLPLKNSDPTTFTEINDVWAKDKNNVYWFGKIYKNADAKTFEKISEPPLTWVDYARDKNNVYIANGQTFKKGLQGKSFELINEFWAKDNFVVYCVKTARVMKSIDVKTFKVLDEKGKAEDKNFIYDFKDYSVNKTRKTLTSISSY